MALDSLLRVRGGAAGALASFLDVSSGQKSDQQCRWQLLRVRVRPPRHAGPLPGMRHDSAGKGKGQPLRRKLFTIFAAVSLLLCVATITLWIRSFYRMDGLNWVRRGHVVGYNSCQGRMTFTFGSTTR